MVLNNLFPVFALILFGNVLRRYRFTDDAFVRISDRLIYYFFFPVLLFWKIGGTSINFLDNFGLYKAVICAVLAVYALSAIYIKFFKVPAFQAGSFSQSCYRFNTYIGVAIVFNALGEEGIQQFGILIGIIIPLINVLAVLTLTWYSIEQPLPGKRIGQALKALISNPLIIACIGGIVYANWQARFPQFIDNTLRLASYVTLPLALLSIGSILTISRLKVHFKLALVACLFKLLVLPMIGFVFLRVFTVGGVAFKLGMIYFTLPTSTALYVLSSQLKSDTELASASIALSTILSFLPLSVALLL